MGLTMKVNDNTLGAVFWLTGESGDAAGSEIRSKDFFFRYDRYPCPMPSGAAAHHDVPQLRNLGKGSRADHASHRRARVTRLEAGESTHFA